MKLAGDVDVHLERLGRPPARRRGRVEDEQDVVARRGRASAAGRTRACPRARPGAGSSARRAGRPPRRTGATRSIQKNWSALAQRARSAPVDLGEDVHGARPCAASGSAAAGAGSCCAAGPGRSATRRRARRAAVAIAAIVRPVPSASTNARSVGVAHGVPARRWSRRRSRARRRAARASPRGRAGATARGRGGRSRPPARRARRRRTCRRPCASCDSVPDATPRLRAVDGVHRRRAHRRHREAHAERRAG